MEVYVVSHKDLGLIAIFSTAAEAKNFVAEEMEELGISGFEIETHSV